MKKRSIVLIAMVLLLFLQAVTALERGRHRETAQQLEEVLRRTAVSCYAAEGFYPPDVEYMREHYALLYDEKDYIVHYELFASNLMPDITVLDNHDE